MLYAVLHYATWSMHKQVPAPADPPDIDPPPASKIRIWHKGPLFGSMLLLETHPLSNRGYHLG